MGSIFSDIDIQKKLVIIGGGGHSRSVIDSLMDDHDYLEIVIIDPRIEVGKIVHGCRVAGGDNELAKLYEDGFLYAFIGIGGIKDSGLRCRLNGIISDIGYTLPIIIDPSAVVSDDTRLEMGVYVGKHATINPGVQIGQNAIINTGAIVEHDCYIGEYSHVAVGAVICGGCTIEDSVFIGAGATIIQGVKIGTGSVVGAGSIVLRDVPGNTRVVGLWKG